MKITDGRFSVENEIKRMMENWQIWLEKIRYATMKVLPHSQINLEKRQENGNTIITFIIEAESLPRDRFMVNNIVNEIFRRAELPIYNPFHIILKSLDDNRQLEISKPR